MKTQSVVGLLVLVFCFALCASSQPQVSLAKVADASPLYAHLALTHKPSELVVSWFSHGAPTGVSTVRYGTSSGQYTSVATGTNRTYHENAGYCHDVTITGLKQGIKYYYVCGNAKDGWSKEYYFTLKRVTNKPNKLNPLVVPIFGDMGIVHSEATIKALEKLSNVDFFYHVGDISYADDRPSFWYEKVWNDWFADMANIMPYTPYMVLPGNHEHSSGPIVLDYSKDFKVYNYRFSMPNNTGENMWYSFDYENVHFISMSTETDYPGCQFSAKFGDQLAWLKADLAEANKPENRLARPWIIVSGHRPLYSSEKSDYVQKYVVPLQTAIEELLHEHQVDIFFCGHVHAYERTYPVYKDKVVTKSYDKPGAIVVVTTGAAGDIEGLTHNFSQPPKDWSANIYDQETGYGILTVYGDHELKWNFYRATDSKLMDTFTLTK